MEHDIEIDLHCERISPTGGMAAQGIRNLLGRPELDLITVLVRETAQNSWDARLSNDEPVRFEIDYREATSEQRRILKETIFEELPYRGRLPLHESLQKRPLRLLSITDRGTKGLGGPVRADELGHPDEPRDFVNLLRNIGQPQVREHAGGQFGFGKSILFLASQAGTVCVHTRSLSHGRLVQRFIAVALGESYQIDSGSSKGMYSGRHWWGRMDNGIVDPIVGPDAGGLAKSIGLPTFGETERGTSFLIIDPDFGSLSPTQVMNRFKMALLWWFWPKMLAPHGEQSPMEFRLSHDGRNVSIPHPRRFGPLRTFVEAREILRTKEAPRYTAALSDIRCQRPVQHLGQVAFVRSTVQEAATLDLGAPEQDDESESGDFATPIQGMCHHVALLRQPELVVSYLAGPTSSSGMIQYAGVFLADPDVDNVFAHSEPPTHDAFKPDLLPDKREQRLVRVALKRIREKATEFIEPLEHSEPPIESGVTVGHLANELGRLLIGISGPSSKVPRPGSGGTGQGGGGGGVGSRLPRIEYFGHLGSLDIIRGERALVMPFRVWHEPSSNGTTVAVSARAVVDGDQPEKEAPIGARETRVLFWRTRTGTTLGNGEELTVKPNMNSVLEVAVSIPEDAKMRVTLHARKK